MSARVCGALSQVMQSGQRSSTRTTSEPLASQRSGCRNVDPQRGHMVIAAMARSYAPVRTEIGLCSAYHAADNSAQEAYGQSQPEPWTGPARLPGREPPGRVDGHDLRR